MSFYRIVLKRSEVFETVVKAGDIEEARRIASEKGVRELDRLEEHPLWIYDVTELQPKPEITFRGEYTDTL